ncbi:3-hydroxyacyl-CoA dehydrogenase family protein [Streptomyces sp. HNM0575]|uniref:3-hydroxyacyl-CoA dehydrogenase family protein n=1 Tax=Streptomyces sp. HNM0575 TaxID=2716338 RepID=UPI00145E290E|nr:3-hydroxyacyl-CoA dehydrogenase family protein [Streptomyces sp. HNM0575]NLU74415.1 3-hydroxyacyl-CoA dehydrogenase family protein [Streptomyces sp. HNM0575]
MSDETTGRTATPRIDALGVLGAGTIGSSVAHAALASGLDVTLVDTDPDALEAARRGIERHRRAERLGGGRQSGTQGELSTATELDALGTADLVVENTTESETAKRALYPELEKALRPGTVIAANTSAVPIARLAEPLRSPERVVGVHFMNPVARIGTVEVIRAKTTSDAAMGAVGALLDRMGKESVVVADAPGFVINRILMVVCNLAAAVVDDGTATPAQVDALFKGCLGHSSGPLRTADLIGLDTVARTLDVLHEHYGSAEFVTHPRLRHMVEQGLLGVKSGRGFYSYDGS